MTPLIDLSTERMANAHWLDLEYLAALMLWSDDLRAVEAAKESAVAHGVGLLAGVQQMRPDLVTEPLPVEAVTFVQQAPRLSDLKVSKRLEEGTFCGAVFVEVVEDYELNPNRAGLEAKRRELIERWGLSVEVESTERWWKRLRPVLPLWAARHTLISELGKDGCRSIQFPCSSDQLPFFMACSEFYRRRGEAIRTRQANEEVLPQGVAFRLRSDIPLPVIDIGIAAKTAPNRDETD